MKVKARHPTSLYCWVGRVCCRPESLPFAVTTTGDAFSLEGLDLSCSRV